MAKSQSLCVPLYLDKNYVAFVTTFRNSDESNMSDHGESSQMSQMKNMDFKKPNNAFYEMY
jgi:hypothetical protein